MHTRYDIKVSFLTQLLRSVGLGILNEANSRLRGRKHRSEEKKIVIRKSRWTALSRCGIHVLPVLISTAILIVNFRQVFIGINFHSEIKSETINQAFLQTAAKLQELLIVASLTTIIFQLLRHELTHGGGIPLGMIAAGIEFAKLSYFWSPDFLGGARRMFQGPRRLQRIAIFLFLILAGGLAALAGPSCAVLLLPQEQAWPMGGTSFFLNGTKDDFWPLIITGNHLGIESWCSSPNSTGYAVCPSGGFYSLWSHYSQVDHSNYMSSVPTYAYDLSGNHYYWTVTSQQPIIARTISLGIPNGATWVVQPHLSVAIILNQLTQDWWTAILANTREQPSNIGDRQATSRAMNPIASARCSEGQMLAATDRSVVFPALEAGGDQFQQDLPNSTLSDQPTNHLRFSWMPLPNAASAVSTWAVLQSPWTADNRSRLVVGCSVQAQWVPSQIMTDAYTFWQGWYPKNVSFEAMYPKKGMPLLNGTGFASRDSIIVDESWLDMLTPPTPTEGPGYVNWRPSTIESIINSAKLMDDIIDVEDHSPLEIWVNGTDSSRPDLLSSIIQSVFADGLSRINVDRLYNKNGSASSWTLADYGKRTDYNDLILQGEKGAIDIPDVLPDPSNTLNVRFSISGLSYRLTLVQKLAMVVLVLHMAAALVHTTWTLYRRESSGCWDSVTEILVLAQNSRPAYNTLRNTAAGIECSSTFAKKMTIRPTKLPDSENADHLEFLYEEEEIHQQTAKELMQVEHSQHSNTGRQSIHEAFTAAESSSLGVARSGTWPASRRPSAVSALVLSGPMADEHNSTPSTPLLATHPDLQQPADSRVRVNCRYG